MPQDDQYSDVGVIARTPQSEIHQTSPTNVVWVGEQPFMGGRPIPGTGLEPSTNDLISRAIASRQAIEHNRQNLAASYPSNRSLQPRWNAAIRELDRQEHGLEFDTGVQLRSLHADQSMRERIAEHAATAADRDLGRRHKTDIDAQAAGAMDEMLSAHQAFHSGQMSKEDYDNVLLSIPERYPLGITHGAAAQHLRFASEVSDKLDEYRSRLAERNMGLLARKYGIGAQTDPKTGEFSSELTESAIRQTPQFKNEQLGLMNKELLNRYGLATGIASIFTPVQQHQGGVVDDKGVFSPTAANQTHIGIPFVDKKTGAVGRVGVPIPIFNQIKSDFEPAYREVTGAGQLTVGSSSPTPASVSHPLDSTAIEWAKANRNDPRSDRIFQLLGFAKISGALNQ